MSLWRDVRHGVRLLARARGFTALAVLTLALGIGATTAIVSLVRAIYFNPLAVEDGSRLVEVTQTLAHRTERLGFPISLPDYRHYRDRARAVQELAAHYPTAPFHLVTERPGTGSRTAEIFGSVVSANYFATLRLRPQLGRFFLAHEDVAPDRDPVAVIGDELWRGHFDADPQVVGRTLSLNGRTFTIVGVAPGAFFGAQPGVLRSEVWIPTAMFSVGYRAGCDAFRADCRLLSFIGRLAPGTTLATAQAEMDLLASHLVAASPDTHTGRGIDVRLLRGVRLTEQASHAPTVRLLFAIVVCVLVMACANLAGLLLARNVMRRKEVAIRLALGAGRWRLLRQFLVESVLLALFGGAAGVLVAIWGNELLRTSFGANYVDARSNFGVPIDGVVLGLTLALSLATALLFGLAPACAALRPDVARVIKDEAVSGGSSRSWLRDALVIAQIAASVTLLTGAGLLTRSLADVLRGPGYDVDHVLLLRLRPGQAGYAGPQSRAYQQEALRRIAALPEVRSAAVAALPPLPGWGARPNVTRGRGPTGPAASTLDATFNRVGSRYFETLGVSLLDGREFDDRDRPETSPVAVISASLAQRFWAGARAIGGTVLVDGAPYEVVGVAADAQFAPAGERPGPAVYLAFWQLPSTHRQMGDSTTHVRVKGDAAAALARIRQEVGALDADVPMGAWTLSMRVSDAFQNVRVTGALTACAGVLALLLSAIGVFGLLAFAVNQRRRELAIRATLGAEPRDLARLVVGRSLRLTAIGVAIGLVAASQAARLLTSMLYGVQPNDPLTLIVACGAIAIVAAIATWLPMRRAASVDPNSLLRES